MPKIVMYYDSAKLKLFPELLNEIGAHLAVAVADAMSTTEVKLEPTRDIDFLPFKYPAGYIGLPVSFEIEAIGFPERKAKVTKLVMLDLKQKFRYILLKLAHINVAEDAGLIWLKYVDPDGHHV